MGLIPPTTHGKIGFFASKTAPWAAHAAEIGVAPAAVTAVAARVAAAREKLAAQVAAQQAALAATADLHQSLRDLVRAGGDVVKQIRAKAAADGDEGVYVLAQIPAPARPSPLPAPGTPTRFSAILNPDGSLRLRWKCPNPAGSSGTIYQVARRTGGGAAGGPFVAIGATGKKHFRDATVPAGAAAVTYEVVAVRSTATGTAARFTVNLGVGVVGGAEGAGVDTPKLAA